MNKSPFVEASFYLLLRIDRSFVAENGQNGHISKVLRLNQCCERGEGVYQSRRLPEVMTIGDHLHLFITYLFAGNSPAQQKTPLEGGVSIKNCGPRRARTVDPRIKSPLLYRLSYRPHCTRFLRVLCVNHCCGRNRIGDLEPWRHARNQSRDGFSRGMGCAKTTPKPATRSHRKYLLIRCPKNPDTYKPQQQ